MKPLQRILVMLSLCFAAACSKPLLKVDANTPSAQVTFKNNSTGYLQQFYFDDPVACKGPKSIDYSLYPMKSSSHPIPADKVITIWTSGFGLPADPGKVAWCGPSAFSTKLAAGQRYVISFEIDTEKKLCGTILLTDSGQPAARVERRVDGPEVGGGGPMAGSFSCDQNDDLSVLVR